MKKVLFIDRDGTLVLEPYDNQLDHLEKLEFYPEAIKYLGKIASELDFEFVMVTNQDGLGTSSFPEENFWPIQNLILSVFKNEGVEFKNVIIDCTFPGEKAQTRKPGIALLKEYFDTEKYDLENSFVIGDRLTDMELARNLNCRGIFLNSCSELGEKEISVEKNDIEPYISLKTTRWKEVYNFLKLGNRTAEIFRKTRETDIYIKLDLNGSGKSKIGTGIGFFDHMLEQISRHAQIDLEIYVKGDLEVDEHHSIEDTGIALGEAFLKALGNKLGMERYGFVLPMDDCLAQVALDFGGRSWLVWDAEFRREMIGKMPTEMFFHFFKSFSDAAKANLNIKAEGQNEHHKIEAIFKAFAKAIKAAIKQDPEKMILPSTKGMVERPLTLEGKIKKNNKV